MKELNMDALPDLHRHLDGSLRPKTLLELARIQGIALPSVPRFYPAMGLSEALSCFATTLSVLQTP
ncbi:adenosine deaminase, partial [Myxococcota bacterium]|nr:adenosine deaminase [Myxococcota bacterium]MBU1537387.1 adenosine deaminase [Myxococcota bacterium]